MPLYWGTQKIGEVYTENHEHIWVDINNIYPIGSVYISVTSSNPSELFGGTWEQIKDKFLLSAGDSYSNGSTGGSATKNLQHNHTTGEHTLTTTEIPSHTHGSKTLTGWAKYHGFPAGVVEGAGGIVAAATKFNSTYHKSDNDTGSGAASWQQINITATHTHDAVGSGGSHSHGDTGNAGSTTQDIMPPYLTVYMWKRTA